jgi:hypothetical protein
MDVWKASSIPQCDTNQPVTPIRNSRNRSGMAPERRIGAGDAGDSTLQNVRRNVHVAFDAIISKRSACLI